MSRTVWARIGMVVGILIIVGLVGAGAFWAGAHYSGGWVAGNMPQMMNPGVQGMPGTWMRGGPMMMSGWGFGPFSLIFGVLRFAFFIGAIFLVIGLFRRLFFGWGPRSWGGHGPAAFEGRARERFEAWHREAHGEQTPPPAPPTP